MIKIKFKPSPRLIIRYTYVIIFVLALASLAITSLFLYKNFYETIIQSQEVIILKEKVAVETINVKKFDNIIKAIEDKAVEKPAGDFKDIFR